jgi:hypothetical protein
MWWWSDLSFASLQHHHISLLERSKTQITPPSDLFVGEKQNSNHSTIRSLCWREDKEIWAWRWCDIKFLPFNLRNMLDRMISLVFSVYCTPCEHPNNYKHIRDDLFIKDTAVLS